MFTDLNIKKTLNIKATKCKNPFLPGMVFKSETHPHMDMIINSVWYTKSVNGVTQLIDWNLINYKSFNEFLISKGITGETTFPYPCCGACIHNSMKAKLKKYNLELANQEDFIVVNNDEVEFSAYLTQEVKDKYDELWDKEKE